MVHNFVNSLFADSIDRSQIHFVAFVAIFKKILTKLDKNHITSGQIIEFERENKNSAYLAVVAILLLHWRYRILVALVVTLRWRLLLLLLLMLVLMLIWSHV